MSALAAIVGLAASGAAWVLVKLIAIVTGFAFYGGFHTSLRVPDPHRLGPWSIVIPAVGGLIVGLMARYGSERIRGHGTPETIEAVLLNGSKIAPRMLFLKPTSAAIAIGTGGPFGAEGPIIATGGALGSLLAQLLTLSADERKVLLVAGAAGGMSAIFGTPVAALLFAIELLLYEYRARSLVPVAIASAVADLARGPLLGRGALFVEPSSLHLSGGADASALAFGIVVGFAAVGLTWLVHSSEHAFSLLGKRLHWMWWPALGGLLIGIGGEIEPRALGVGYTSIDDSFLGHITVGVAISLLFVKAVIWSIGIGSGTSGGVVAPVLLMGVALGTMANAFLPGIGTGGWALLGMAALMAAVLRAPLTAIVFALELSQRPSALLPLLLTVIPAYAVTALLVRRSVLTERMSRKGAHVRTELDLDPLETLLVSDVIGPALTLSGSLRLAEAATIVLADRNETSSATGVQQRLYPVIGVNGELIGALPRRLVINHALFDAPSPGPEISSVMVRDPVTCAPGITLRTAATLMADHGVTRLPVIADGRVMGVLSLSAVLRARLRDLAEDRDAERILRLRVPVARSRV